MTAPDPTPAPAPDCEHNWPGITALTIPFTACAFISVLIWGGYPPHGQWQAVCWLLLAIALVLAVALTVAAWRQDHWRSLAHQRAAIIRNQDAEIRQLRGPVSGREGAPMREYVPLAPAEHDVWHGLVQGLLKDGE